MSEGDHVDLFKHIFVRSVDTIEDHELPIDAETWSHFCARIILALTEILNNTDKPPLIVAHGGVFLGISAILECREMRAKNCQPYLFKAPDEVFGRWNIVSLEGNED